MKHTLKVGDKIAEIQNRVTGIYTVSRVTATTAVIVVNGHEVKFKNPVNPDWFYRIGRDTWSRVSYKLATEKDAQAFEMSRLRALLTNTKWGEVPNESIEKIVEILKTKTI